MRDIEILIFRIIFNLFIFILIDFLLEIRVRDLFIYFVERLY